MFEMELEAYFEVYRRVCDANNLEGQIALMNTAISEWPYCASLHFNLGVSLAYAGRYAEAEQAYRGAIELDPDDSEFHYSLANTLKRLKRYGDCIRAFERSIELDPSHVEPYNNLGLLYLHLDEPERALQVLETASARFPPDSDIFGNMFTALCALDRETEARLLLQEVEAVGHDSAEWLSGFARCYEELDELKKAEELFLRSVALEPAEALYTLRFCQLLQETEREAQAADTARRFLVEHHPHDCTEEMLDDLREIAFGPGYRH